MSHGELKTIQHPPSEILGRYEHSLGRLTRSRERLALDQRDSRSILGKLIVGLERIREFAARTAHSPNVREVAGYTDYYREELVAIRDEDPAAAGLLHLDAHGDRLSETTPHVVGESPIADQTVE